MSRLLASRAALLGALSAAGINTGTSGKFSAPCVIVEPGDPWASVEVSLGRERMGRWLLTLVAGRADTDGSFELLAEFVDRVDVALLTIKCQLPTWSRPFNWAPGNIGYTATTATIQFRTQPLPPEEVLP